MININERNVFENWTGGKHQIPVVRLQLFSLPFIPESIYLNKNVLNIDMLSRY